MTYEQEFEAIADVSYFKEFLAFTASKGFVLNDPTDILTAWELLYDHDDEPVRLVSNFYDTHLKPAQ